jgi:hypothetical protein
MLKGFLIIRRNIIYLYFEYSTRTIKGGSPMKGGKKHDGIYVAARQSLKLNQNLKASFI